MDRNDRLHHIPRGILDLLVALSSYGPQAVEIGLSLVEPRQMANLHALHCLNYPRSEIARSLCARPQPQRG